MSIYQTNVRLSHPEAGATLIVVLAMVLLLGLLAVIAVRGLQTSMGMTTSSQVNKLLVQSSDVPLAKLEMANIDKDSSNQPLIAAMATGQGPLGFLQIEGNKDAEYVLCYQPTDRQNLYAGPEQHLINLSPTSTRGLSTGYCNINASDPSKYYTSGRQTAASQLVMNRPTVNAYASDDPFFVPPLSAANEGIDEASIKVEKSAYMRAYVTSVVPNLALNASKSDIDACLKRPIGGMTETIATDETDATKLGQIACLTRLDVPTNVQVQDFAFNMDAK